MPSKPHIAMEKLHGWSVCIDVFHGEATAIAVAVRNAVHALGPYFNRVADMMADNHARGMDLVMRILFEMQQEYFDWLANQAVSAATPVPDFLRIIQSVKTFRVNVLSPLPQHWYTLVQAPVKADSPPKANEPSNPRKAAGAVAAVSANPDRLLLRRFADSSHSNITSMTNGHEIEVPQHNGKDVCLIWALKGECSTGCKRKDAHVRYPKAVNTKVHELLDTCGVARA